MLLSGAVLHAPCTTNRALAPRILHTPPGHACPVSTMRWPHVFAHATPALRTSRASTASPSARAAVDLTDGAIDRVIGSAGPAPEPRLGEAAPALRQAAASDG